MRREWEPEELIACRTLVEADQELVANKRGATRLGFAWLLKFLELEARFPGDVGELPPAAINYTAESVRVDAAELDAYAWSGRTIEYHRAQVPHAYGFPGDGSQRRKRAGGVLAEEVCPSRCLVTAFASGARALHHAVGRSPRRSAGQGC